MKGTCKVCGSVIETEPDPLMDEQRDQRERTAFFNRVAYHIDPRNKICRVNNQKFVTGRFAMLSQDNGWFQRWRLLACLTDLDETLRAKKEEWREYLHIITSIEASQPPEAPAPTEPAKVN